MSGIVLSASVRQNLLSLQSTASLLATTQNNLATGNKVNSALDNPTNFFTAQGLNNRASDIGNLLDQIGNGVQVLQAANTGITSLQGYIASAQSIANQVLQAPTGYTTKSSVSTTVAGATADNLLGTPAAFTDATAAAGTAIPGATALTTKLSALTTAITATDSFTVDGKTISFASITGSTSTAAGASLDLSTATVGDLLNAVDAITGNPAATSTLAAGALTLHTGTAQSLVIGGTASTLTALGLAPGTTARGGGTTALGGQVLNIAATTTDGSTTATALTFGAGAGQIHTLNDLNAKLAGNDLQASIDSTGTLTITTSNNAASKTIGSFTGSGTVFASKTAAAAVVDPNSQATRASLVAQYNQVISNITTTAQDSSFNGINLLNGDTLNLTFDETGASKLSITGVTFNATGLGLASLGAGTDFLDSNSANGVLTKLTQASTVLRTEASALGSNLSVVQIRQDFNKNLINVLQTGASNLTLADPNQEAANSQALSTRQSIAVSALALANQSQQSVLQLLR
jgi:flagellin